MNRGWIVDLVARLPQGAISRLWGMMARMRRPKIFVRLLKSVFASRVGIDFSESAAPIEHFATLEEMFVRQLKAGTRPIDTHPLSFVSPVDGRVGASGLVHNGTLLQIKGRSYSLGGLLDDPLAATRFEGGAYITLYLSPRDYHRIHAPLAGAVHQATLIPGALLPVFEEALHRVDGLFARNERIITYLDSQTAGRVAVIKVGATLVGRIRLSYDASFVGNQHDSKRRQVNYSPAHMLGKGDELGVFELGSTVVLVSEAHKIKLDPLSFGNFVRVGQRIGELGQANTVTQ